MFRSASGGLTLSGWFMVLVGAWMIIAGLIIMSGKGSARFRPPLPKPFDRLFGVVGLAAGTLFIVVAVTAKAGHLY